QMEEITIQKFSPLTTHEIKQEVIRVKDITSLDQLAALSTGQKTTSFSYLDGLSRPIQEVVQMVSPEGYDIVHHIEYDGNGRSSKSYLPYISTGTSGTFQQSVLSDQASFYNNSSDKVADDSSPFSKTVFDNSPLGRVNEQ